jgi:uncharacterized membrane protein
MTVPPYSLASMGIAFGAWLAARTGRRAPLIIGSGIVAILGMPCSSSFFLDLNPYAGYIVLLTTNTRTLSFTETG